MVNNDTSFQSTPLAHSCAKDRELVTNRIVAKFGGSSVADAESIKRVAARIAQAQRSGKQVVIVISAMGDTTDDLMDLALQVSPQPRPRELDMLLTTGERQSAALLSMALNDLGVEALSYTGSQAGVITTNTHGDARILDITPRRVAESLEEGMVVIVAGFQGVSYDTKDVTTLGRGASDTTAVALASALGAEVCEIYTDVDGVFTADPRIAKGARKIDEITYEEMLEMAANGAKVLHLRCVEYARRENVAIHVRSSFTDKPGTIVRGSIEDGDLTAAEEQRMEQVLISGIAHDRSQSKITVQGVPDQIGKAARIFSLIAKNNINIDMIVQNISEVSTGATDITFTLPSEDTERAMSALKDAQEEIGFTGLLFDEQVGKISVIGVGMRSNPGVTAKFFEALADNEINIQMISTSEIRISVVVDIDQLNDAVRVAHSAFDLDADTEAIVYAGTGR